MAAAFTATFRVVSINETGDDRIVVNFVQEFPEGSTAFHSPMSLNLSSEEAAGYFPGQTYTVTLTATA